MTINELIVQYVDGVDQLSQAIAGMSTSELDAVPIPGQWSTRQVVCHISDFETVYADRLKRVIAEPEPTFFGGDPDVFAAALAYELRDVQEEMKLIAATRHQVARILKSLDRIAFQRIGHHNEAGPMTLERLLGNVTGHLPHHVGFIQQKRWALQ